MGCWRLADPARRLGQLVALRAAIGVMYMKASERRVEARSSLHQADLTAHQQPQRFSQKGTTAGKKVQFTVQVVTFTVAY
jgi:hypothetical protein